MNIIDLPPELFELILKDIFHPHVILINKYCEYYNYTYYYDMACAYAIVSYIYKNNNRILILYYFSYNCNTFLYYQLKRTIYFCCAVYNNFNTLNCIYNNELVNINNLEDISWAILLNRIHIIRWMKSVGIKFTQDHIDCAFIHNRHRILKLISN